jgi:mycothiol synthase
MFTIRPFAGDDEYAGLAALVAAIWPDRDADIAALQHFDQAHSNGFFFQRLMVAVDLRFVGYCEFGEPADSYRPGKYAFEIGILPTLRRCGLGGALFDQMLNVLAARPLPPALLVCRTQEDHPEAVRFLQKRNFEQVMRSHLARLDVARFDRRPYTDLIAKLASTGIELRSLAALSQVDPDWQRKVYELDWACTLDEPLPDTPTKPPFAHYVTEIFGNPDFWPQAWFVAVDGGRYVGMAAANRNRRHPHQLDTFFTGIVRSHRRRGIATALKVLMIDYAQAKGFTCIKTDNEEHNPMFQINLALGFRPEPGLLFFQKTIAYAHS